jgi:DNA-binding transcriptional ArsR family regulator
MTEAAHRAATPAEFKAMAHPLRLRILRLCLHEPRTNKELADRLGKDPATVLHHVRLLERTGFLAAARPRHGAKGALEKPYLATRKSWVLSPTSPEDELVNRTAVIDALRAELLEAGPDGVVEGARLGVQLSPAKVKRYRARIERLIKDLHDEPDEPGGERLGFYVVLHKRERS